MAHIFYINDLERLNIKKDSTLMMAMTLAPHEECYIMFENDLYISNDKNHSYKLHSFKGKFKEDGYYLENFELTESIDYNFSEHDTIYMRIDPPFDSRYQRYLWMLDFLQRQLNVEVKNNPLGIMKYNEKLTAFLDGEHSVESYVGSSLDSFKKFVSEQKNKSVSNLILKPLDLYSGIGVQKINIEAEDLESLFENKVKEFHGAIVCQPFVEKVSEGEIRAIFYQNKEIGSIIKRPKEGEFLANIAQGASFEKIELDHAIHEKCLKICEMMAMDGVDLLAFDILDNKINEINITCPGLLVEVSHACKKNLCYDIFNL